MTKEQLKTYRSITLERDRLLIMIEELEAQMRSPKSQLIDGMPHGGTAPSSVVENLVVKHVELVERYHQKVAELTAAAVEIETAIESLQPRERTLIRLHYIEGLTWEEVCVAMTYSWRQVHRIHAKALEALKNKA
jgi:RNA polymerase sigma factor (sigma-70 family)